MEHRESDRGFRFKSLPERLLPLRSSECRNCTRLAVPGGRLCEACTINARTDSSIGRYPTLAAVGLVWGIAGLIAVPFILGGDNTPDKPTQAAAAPAAEQDLEPFPGRDVASETDYSAPEARSALSDDEFAAELNAAFITKLKASGVMFTSSEKAVRVGNQICTDIATVPAEFSDELARDQAEAILVGEGYSDNDAAAYIGAAVGALC